MKQSQRPYYSELDNAVRDMWLEHYARTHASTLPGGTGLQFARPGDFVLCVASRKSENGRRQLTVHGQVYELASISTRSPLDYFRKHSNWKNPSADIEWTNLEINVDVYPYRRGYRTKNFVFIPPGPREQRAYEDPKPEPEYLRKNREEREHAARREAARVSAAIHRLSGTKTLREICID